MKTFLQKNFENTPPWQTLVLIIVLGIGVFSFTSPGQNILALLASATSSLTGAPAVLYFTPYSDNTIQIGEVRKVDININAHVPINAMGITIKFPQDLLEIVGVSKEKSFLDLWTEDTAIKEEIGEVHFSGGTIRKGGLIGTSTALTLSVRAKRSGRAELYFENAQILAGNGTGESVGSDTRPLTFVIPEKPIPPVVSISGGTTLSAATAPPGPLPRSPDLNNDGKITLTDVSILVLHLFGPYDPRYDFDMNGSVGISDLSILFSKMGT